MGFVMDASKNSVSRHGVFRVDRTMSMGLPMNNLALAGNKSHEAWNLTTIDELVEDTANAFEPLG